MEKQPITNIIKKYYDDISMVTNNFTNEIHLLAREWNIIEEDRKKFEELIQASWYFSEFFEDKQKWPWFKNNLDILQIVYKYFENKDI